MNNVIEDLMYRSGITAQGCWDEMDEYDRGAVERLIYMVIDECAKSMRPHLRDMISRGQAADIIKQHFGVNSD